MRCVLQFNVCEKLANNLRYVILYLLKLLLLSAAFLALFCILHVL